jgi:hypothetical protein
MTASAVPTAQLDLLAHRDHPEPHAVLGAHPGAKDGRVIVRALRPAAQTVTVHPAQGKAVQLTQIHPAGIFEGELAGELPLRYELEVDYGPGGTFRIADPYAFLPTLGELDLHLMGEGRHEAIYDKLGVGPGRALGQRRRRLQLLGRPHPPDALDGDRRDLGAVHPGSRRGSELQVRDQDR